MVAKIIVNSSANELNRVFDYNVPERDGCKNRHEGVSTFR